jgi:hypothetical protein
MSACQECVYDYGQFHSVQRLSEAHYSQESQLLSVWLAVAAVESFGLVDWSKLGLKLPPTSSLLSAETSWLQPNGTACRVGCTTGVVSLPRVAVT